MDRTSAKKILRVDAVKPAAGWNAILAKLQENLHYEGRNNYYESIFEPERVPLLGWAAYKPSESKGALTAGHNKPDPELVMVGVLAVGRRVALCEDVFWFLGYLHEKNAQELPKLYRREMARFEERFAASLLDGTVGNYRRDERERLKSFADEEPETEVLWQPLDDPKRHPLSLAEVFEEERDRFGFG